MPQKNKRILSKQEEEQIYKTAEDERIYMLFKTTLKHGLRNSEAVNLQKKNIHFDNATLEILDSKNGKDRTLPIPKDFLSELDIYTSNMSGKEYLFKSKITKTGLSSRSFQKKLRRAVVNAGLYPTGVTVDNVTEEIEYRNRIVPHSLRHTYATRLLRNGVEMQKVSKLLGHSKVTTTVDVYGHLNVEDVREEVDQHI